MKGATCETSRGFWTVFPGFCKGCGLCLQKCPQKCLSWSDTLGVYGTLSVQNDSSRCITCGICQNVCPDCALLVERKS